MDGIIIAAVKRGMPLIEIYEELSDRADKIAFYKTVLHLIQENKIPNVLLCYCGHDCARCRTFHATLHDDSAMREEIRVFYNAEFKQEIPSNSLRCLSGRSDEIMEGCGHCPYRKCAREKGLSACVECSGYPCESLDWYLNAYVNKVNQI